MSDLKLQKTVVVSENVVYPPDSWPFTVTGTCLNKLGDFVGILCSDEPIYLQSHMYIYIHIHTNTVCVYT